MYTGAFGVANLFWLDMRGEGVRIVFAMVSHDECEGREAEGVRGGEDIIWMSGYSYMTEPLSWRCICTVYMYSLMANAADFAYFRRGHSDPSFTNMHFSFTLFMTESCLAES